ncbi:MAG: M20 family metallopeptidase [Prosthecochloris sp.]|uniref:M20 metallopeptidase family protein n=1 Tax=Prosthecochloris sp. TaxID=290513 RepID=UPI00258395B3|nr:M20 family metallopeptidase [Prosthecochloris sp.]MCW8798152.1 M20 family metallopeptidase [Prosthecochloris sp.]
MSEISRGTRDRIGSRADELYPVVRDIRRDIHRHPELSFQEFRTTALVRDYLENLGFEFAPRYLETGVVALLRSLNPSAQHERVVVLRADIDALPLQEENISDFCSGEAGCMHACGHDMHTAILLGTASLLSEFRHELPGDILFVFQPAEEKAPGGAKPMIEAGLFRDYTPAMIFALHCFPHIRSGNVALREGSLMAAADELYITVHGEGGHASAPHKAADPILASAHIITALQHLVSRVSSPYEPAVLTISSISGGHATNVIPENVVMSGTMRIMNEELRSTFHHRLKKTVEQVADALGVSAELDIVHGYPVLVNDAAAFGLARDAAEEMLGASHVEESEPLMTAEDFAWYLQECPGAFIQLGTGRNEDRKGDQLHSPYFDPDETALKTGMEVMSYTAIKALARLAGG